MAVVEALIEARLYICDWIDDASDMDKQDLDPYTYGTDYCYIPCETFRGSGDQEGELVKYPGGVGFKFAYDQDKDAPFIASSDHLTKAEFAAVKKYWKVHRGKGSDPDYLIFFRAANNYYPFHDKDGDETQYLRGWFRKKPYEGWTNAIPDLYGIRIQFEEVWS